MQCVMKKSSVRGALLFVVICVMVACTQQCATTSQSGLQTVWNSATNVQRGELLVGIAQDEISAYWAIAKQYSQSGPTQAQVFQNKIAPVFSTANTALNVAISIVSVAKAAGADTIDLQQVQAKISEATFAVTKLMIELGLVKTTSLKQNLFMDTAEVKPWQAEIFAKQGHYMEVH